LASGELGESVFAHHPAGHPARLCQLRSLSPGCGREQRGPAHQGEWIL